MAIYSTEEIHLGQYTQKAFNTMPQKAMVQTPTQSKVPVEGFSAIRHTGVYVPAIKMEIII